jgi:hypothetical protein
MNLQLKFLDAILGITDNSTENRISKLLMGIIVPALPVLYGVSSVLSRHSKFIGRGRMADLSGLAAVAAGIGYLSLGLFIHVHYCWKDHPKLAGGADAASVFLILVVGLALLFMFLGVLM